MTKVCIIANPNSDHQTKHAQAMQSGLKVHGFDSVIVSSYSQCQSDVVVCWGWRLGKQLRLRGCNVLVMERGYIGDRFKWSSLAFNGLNGLGNFGKVKEYPSRFAKHFEHLYKPWRGRDPSKPCLILGQTAGDASLRGKNMDVWYNVQGKLIHDIVKKNSWFRAHPNEIARGIKRKVIYSETSAHATLEDALADCDVAFTYNSNSGVDALLNGIPVCCEDSGGMVHSLTHNKIPLAIAKGDVEPEGRRKFFERLAWQQWRLLEIENGKALEGLIHLINK